MNFVTGKLLLQTCQPLGAKNLELDLKNTEVWQKKPGDLIDCLKKEEKLAVSRETGGVGRSVTGWLAIHS